MFIIYKTWQDYGILDCEIIINGFHFYMLCYVGTGLIVNGLGSSCGDQDLRVVFDFCSTIGPFNGKEVLEEQLKKPINTIG